MGTRTLPDIPVTEMDQDHLACLIRDALTAFRDFVRARSFQTETVNVYREKGSETYYESLLRPSLRDALFLYQQERMHLPAATALMNYLWEHGGHKLTLTVDNGDPDRAGWANTAFHMIVPNTLWRLWDEYSIRSLSATGAWQPWEVPDDVMDKVAKDMASIEAGKGGEFRITIPLLQVTLSDCDAFQFDSSVTIRRWTPGDRAVYLHRNDRIYSGDDFFAKFYSGSYLEIIANTQEVFGCSERQTAVEDLVGSVLGRVKWAIMRSTNPAQVVIELPATAEMPDSIHGIFPVRRHHVKHAFTSIELNALACQTAAKHLSDLAFALKVFPDIQEVIWMFDRATLAVLPRDILFEAAVGLERLLVAGSGENTRRFKNYGTALLTKGDANKLSDDLQHIYALRSSAAHGAGTGRRRFEDYCIHARTYLSEAIERVVRLVAFLKLRSEMGKTVNIALEQYLLSLLYSAAIDDQIHMVNALPAPA